MTQSSEGTPAIVVDRVGKRFRVPQEQMNTLKERALHPFHRKGFDAFTALEDVSFAVQPGEFFGIVGRNGSGKSTLLKCMAGIYGTDAGAIYINGRLSTFIELGVGFNPDLAARDNVMLNAIMLGLTPSQAKERVESVVEFAELREFVDLKLKNYSSGMHVRLAFSVMIQVDADIMLIDEVLAVGDASFQQKCFDEFARMREQEKTLVLVTHDMGAVSRYCDRAMLLDRGKIITVDNSKEVGNRYLELNFAEQGSIAQSVVEPERSDRAAAIVDGWFENTNGERVASIPQGRPATFRLVVEFYKPCEDPTMGFTIEDENRQVLFASSTIWVGKSTGNFAPGDRAVFTINFDNVFNNGRYYVTSTVCKKGTVTDFIDRRDRMTSIIVRGDFNTNALVQLDYDITIEREPAAIEQSAR